jgi:hypothetical protein
VSFDGAGVLRDRAARRGPSAGHGEASNEEGPVGYRA